MAITNGGKELDLNYAFPAEGWGRVRSWLKREVPQGAGPGGNDRGRTRPEPEHAGPGQTAFSLGEKRTAKNKAGLAGSRTTSKTPSPNPKRRLQGKGCDPQVRGKSGKLWQALVASVENRTPLPLDSPEERGGGGGRVWVY